jgi:glutathione synthase/RimK-type ligase-like ATP-grasp enzyme
MIDSAVEIPEFRDFAARAASAAFLSFLSACPVHNSIPHEMTACYKPYQLWVAQQSGFDVPRTLISNDANAVRRFYGKIRTEGGEVVYKHATAAAGIGIPTRLLDDSDINRLGALQFAPAIFQERIRGGVDLRVTVLGKQVFVSEWRPASLDVNVIDIRDREDARMWAADCPDSLRASLLQSILGLTFGVYDLKCNSEGRPFFLEVNPSGQWLDQELDASHRISEAWARLLVEGPGAESSLRFPSWTRADLESAIGSGIRRDVPQHWSRLI